MLPHISASTRAAGTASRSMATDSESLQPDPFSDIIGPASRLLGVKRAPGRKEAPTGGPGRVRLVHHYRLRTRKTPATAEQCRGLRAGQKSGSSSLPPSSAQSSSPPAADWLAGNSELMSFDSWPLRVPLVITCWLIRPLTSLPTRVSVSTFGLTSNASKNIFRNQCWLSARPVFDRVFLPLNLSLLSAPETTSNSQIQ